MIQPTNKWIMQDYRDIMGTSDAPQMIETEIPIQPVAVINQQLPRPRSNQRIRVFNLSWTATSSTLQVYTKPSNVRAFFIGLASFNPGSVAGMPIWDAVSGSAPSLPANTIVEGTTNGFVQFSAPVGAFGLFFSMPIEIINGLRISYSTSSGGITFYILEEDI